MAEVLDSLSVQEIREKARGDAQSILHTYWEPSPPPVDPVAIARSLGLTVYAADLSGDAIGMLVGGNLGTDIYLDRRQPPTRLRFTCAHEIGHWSLRKDDLTPDVAFIDKRSDGNPYSADEIYANEFAGSLLIPEPALRVAIAAGLPDTSIAQQFDVSLDSLRYRRQLLGLGRVRR